MSRNLLKLCIYIYQHLFQQPDSMCSLSKQQLHFPLSANFIQATENLHGAHNVWIFFSLSVRKQKLTGVPVNKMRKNLLWNRIVSPGNGEKKDVLGFTLCQQNISRKKRRKSRDKRKATVSITDWSGGDEGYEKNVINTFLTAGVGSTPAMNCHCRPQAWNLRPPVLLSFSMLVEGK